MLKTSMTGIILLAFAAAPSAQAAEGEHFPATHCEIFVDRALSTYGSHFGYGITLFVKTHNDRLDGAVAEVGFRSLKTGSDLSGTLHGGWTDRVLTRFFGADDYVTFSGPLEHDFGHYDYQGAFYVKTTKGTYFWRKAADGSDFRIVGALSEALAQEQGFSSVDALAVARALPTRTSAAARGLNPDGCD